MGQTTFTGPVVSQNGFVENSFTTAERDAIVDPQPGLLIYNTTTNTYQVCTVGGGAPTWDTAFGGGGGGSAGFPYLLTQNINSAALGSPGGSQSNKLLFNSSGTQVLNVIGTMGTATLGGFNLSNPYRLNSITSTTYDGYSLSGFVMGAYLNSAGTELTILSASGTGIYGSRVSLNTPNDLTSFNVATASAPFYIDVGVMGSGLGVQSFEISPDGTKLFFTLNDSMAFSSNGYIRRVDLATPYDITSATTSTYSQSVDISSYLSSVSGMMTTPMAFGLAIDSAGTTIFVSTPGDPGTMATVAYVFEFKLGTAFDLTSIQDDYSQNTDWIFGGPSANTGSFSVANCGMTLIPGNIFVGFYDNANGAYYAVPTLTALAVPNITSVSPSSGSVGTTVTIAGTGFNGVSLVTIGGLTASIISSSDTVITVSSPGSTPNVAVDVVVTNPAGSSTEVASFTNTSSVTTYVINTDYTNGAGPDYGLVIDGGMGMPMSLNANVSDWNNSGYYNNLTQQGSGTVYTLSVLGQSVQFTTSNSWVDLGGGNKQVQGTVAGSPMYGNDSVASVSFFS